MPDKESNIDSKVLSNIIHLSIYKAENSATYFDLDTIEFLKNLEGMSSLLFRLFINKLCSSIPCCKYLEVGTHKGSTLFSASYKNKGEFYGIDNFSLFNRDDVARNYFYKKLKMFSTDCNISFFENDFWDIIPSLPSDINVYFFDGNHTDSDQYNAFAKFYKHLQSPCVVIVDDWNWQAVRTATKKAFDELKFKVHSSIERLAAKQGDSDGWWNGVFIGVIEV